MAHLTDEGDGTRVHWVWDFAAVDGPLRLLGPLVGLVGRKLENRVWTDMQHSLDSASTSATGQRHRFS